LEKNHMWVAKTRIFGGSTRAPPAHFNFLSFGQHS
jgi:hypothetical protein